MTPPIPDAAVDAAADALTRELDASGVVTLEDVRRALEAAAPLLAPRWIACTEAHPKEGQHVMTYRPGGGGYSAHFGITSFWDDDFWHGEYIGIHPVTHWMAMPAPPADGAKEGG